MSRVRVPLLTPSRKVRVDRLGPFCIPDNGKEYVGAILMSLSTIVVALNAQLLRRLDLRIPSIAATD